MKITVSKNGPFIVTGGVPLMVMEICNDNEDYCQDMAGNKEISHSGAVRPLPVRPV